MFDTREELINALTEAAELEHGLLCQYLFAALSLKKRTEEGINWEQAELIRGWEGSILEVARQEMGHLGTVSNLLTAIGGAPQFRRPHFPQPARYFPMVTDGTVGYVEFTLEPFSSATIERFVRFEQPEAPLQGLGVAPDPVLYKTIGVLYGEIGEGISHIDERRLFIGPHEAQDVVDWGAGVEIISVRDRASALAAIESIVVAGEGTPAGGGDSHYETFRRIREELLAEKMRDPSFEPARPVVPNPFTPQYPDPARTGTTVEHPLTRAVAELFNAVYATTLLMLMRFYAFAEAGTPEHEALRATTRRIMSGVVRPLGELLTELPVGDHLPGRTAGPGFELYTDLRLPPQAATCWTIFHERLVQEAEECGRLSRQDAAPPRLAFLHRNLELLARSVGVFLQPEGRRDAQDSLRRVVPVPPRH